MAEDKGPGYPTPLYAMKNGPKEELLYVVCINPFPAEGKSDFLATIDVNPESSTYCQIIHKTYTGVPNDQLHHFGWNTCSSCYGKKCTGSVRDKLIAPGLDSNRVYIFDVGKNPKTPGIYKVIDAAEINKWDASYLHSMHCLPSGEVMISHMGDKNGDLKGNFLILDGKTFDIKGTWNNSLMDTCYDFWYQPYHDIMIASEFGAPNVLKQGFHPSLIGSYGKSIHFYTWSTRKHIKTIDLGSDGIVGICCRFLHNPKEAQGYLACALSSTVFRFYKNELGNWDASQVISVKQKKVKGWIMDQMPGLLSDLIISLDDKYLYTSNFLHGDIRQYDITDKENPKLTGQVFLGGLLTTDSDIKIEGDEKPFEPVYIKGNRLYGGLHRLQLSLDGKRLYASSSLYKQWEHKLYPKLLEHGGYIVLVHCDTVNGGLRLDTDFYVDFKEGPDGAVFPHEMRYPGGDSSSDIWLVNDEGNE